MEAARRYHIYQKIKNNKAKVMQIFIVKKVVYIIHIYYYLYQFHLSTHLLNCSDYIKLKGAIILQFWGKINLKTLLIDSPLQLRIGEYSNSNLNFKIILIKVAFP